MTEWRVIPGYPDYEISEDGDIRRAVDAPGTGYRAGRPVRPQIKNDGYGYLVILLRKNGRRCGHHVHRLVALAFLGAPPDPKMDAAHRDGSKANNHWRNLYWATRAQNQQDQFRHGTMRLGVRHRDAKLTDDQVRELRRRAAAGERVTALASEFALHWTTASAIVRRVTWQHVA